MLRATLFYPVDSYPLDRRFIHWIGLIHWISYPPFEQPAPGIYVLYFALNIASTVKYIMYQNIILYKTEYEYYDIANILYYTLIN